MVRNLRMVVWDRLNDPEYGYDWAIEMNNTFKELISNGQYGKLINYESLGRQALLSIPTPEHYFLLLYILGLKNSKEETSFLTVK